MITSAYTSCSRDTELIDECRVVAARSHTAEPDDVHTGGDGEAIGAEAGVSRRRRGKAADDIAVDEHVELLLVAGQGPLRGAQADRVGAGGEVDGLLDAAAALQ